MLNDLLTDIQYQFFMIAVMWYVVVVKIKKTCHLNTTFVDKDMKYRFVSMTLICIGYPKKDIYGIIDFILRMTRL